MLSTPSSNLTRATPAPKEIDEIDTPAVIVDIDKVSANIARAQSYADAHGVRLRPHIKTHKLTEFAKRQVAAGAIGITCQKLGEVEVMAEAGLADILITYNILGAIKLKRLVAASQATRLTITADSTMVVDGYSGAFADAGLEGTVVVECDTGLGRCGVQSPAAALQLAQQIDRSPALSFGGLMTYPADGAVGATNAWLNEAVALLAQNGLACAMVSNGGTPDLWSAHLVEAATEHRPGNYIYFDRLHVSIGVAAVSDCALRVLTTVVSRPTEGRAILDAGSKTLSSDTAGMKGFGLIPEHPQAVIAELNEEHGIVDLLRSERRPAIGDRLTVIPNHACVVTNLFDKVHLVSGNQVVDIVPVAARGRVA